MTQTKKRLLGLGLLVLVLPALAWYLFNKGQTKAGLVVREPTTQNKNEARALQDGDIIFQNSLSGQSEAISLATHSPYTHCGIVYKKDDAFWVHEAVQPVKITPLKVWIKRGEGGHYVVKRLRNAQEVLSTAVIRRMQEIGRGYMGKDYDLTFDWSDTRIYCSELVWKVYKQATGLQVGRLQQLRDFDLTSDIVKKKMKERYGSRIPLDEPVISPAAVFESELLITVAKE